MALGFARSTMAGGGLGRIGDGGRGDGGVVSLVWSQRLLCEAVWLTRAGIGDKGRGKGGM